MTSELTTAKAGMSLRGSPNRLAVGGVSRCSSSRNISYDGHRHPHRAEGLALLTQPTADRAASQTSAHGPVAAWPGPGRGPPSLQLSRAPQRKWEHRLLLRDEESRETLVVLKHLV